MVFSTVRSSQDIFKVMRVNGAEARVIGVSKAFVVLTTLYASGASDPRNSLEVREETKKHNSLVCLRVQYTYFYST